MTNEKNFRELIYGNYGVIPEQVYRTARNGEFETSVTSARNKYAGRKVFAAKAEELGLSSKEVPNSKTLVFVPMS